MTRGPLELMVGGRIPLGLEAASEVKLVELLGVGGQAHVWKAVDPKTGTHFVLKVMRFRDADPTLLERARREADIRIPSPYVVQSRGIVEWDPHTYLLLLDLAEGTPLDEAIAGDSLSNPVKNRVFEHVLRGVRAAHQCNIIHRDLKPQNVIVGADGDARLIDFGISKFADRSRLTGDEVMGTPPYMALELFGRSGVAVADARTDIFALGHILYELAMGAHFWARRGWRDISGFLSYLDANPDAACVVDLADFSCAFNPRVPAVVARMLSIEPDDRYREVSEVLVALGYDSPPPVPVRPAFVLGHPVLVVESGSNRGARTLLSLEPGETRQMGRMEIAGADPSISRRHLEFRRTGDLYFVRDTGSRNGTILSGVRLVPPDTWHQVNPGDKIKVGDVFLRFESDRGS